MRFIIHTVFIVLIALVTLFGLGPVLLADGSMQERTITAAIVVLIYIILAVLYGKVILWSRNRK
ncbi:DUF6954 family protein [Neobacillus muris]|uniref:DUF6954 family protein n=1 Tax=Neobacillus muris TaxID=2941334 RepID=UPI00203A499B|nr:hypothetical protein [Neobacillus muris]